MLLSKVALGAHPALSSTDSQAVHWLWLKQSEGPKSVVDASQARCSASAQRPRQRPRSHVHLRTAEVGVGADSLRPEAIEEQTIG